MSYTQPPPKKSKLEDFRYSHSTEDKSKTNPFSKKIAYRDQNECKDVENLSLIRKASPVKKPINLFKKTIVNEKHNVISRFFQSQPNNVSLPSSNQCSVSTLITQKSEENIVRPLETSDRSNESNESNESNLFDKSKEEVENGSIIDLDSFEEKNPPRVLIKSAPPSKPSALGKCRKVGLAKAKHVPSAAQGKLSSFGFTKK